VNRNHFILFFLFISLLIKSQYQVNVDSLKQVIASMPDDSMKVKKINKVCMFYINSGKYLEADKWISQALILSEKTHFKKGIGNAYNFRGIVCDDRGQLALSLENYFKALKMFDEMALLGGQTDCCNNIGLIYLKQAEYDKALDYFLKAKKYAELSKKKFILDNPLSNIGTVYMRKKDYKNAVLYYQQAYQLRKELGFSEGCIESLNNLGNTCLAMGDTAKGLENYSEALEIARNDSNDRSIAVTEGSLGSALCVHNTALALAYLQSSLAKANRMNLPDLKESVNKVLSKIYERTKQPRLALLHYKNYISARDSLFNEESTKKTIQSEMNYEFDKKETAARLRQEKKEAIVSAEKKKQQVIIWSVCGILLVVVFFALFAYRSFLQKRNANIEITRQKEVIEEKQKEIVDSIYYARRIQRALITNEKYIAKNLSRLKNRN
jgi:tetratricopeptide (TPR) repeat protein